MSGKVYSIDDKQAKEFVDGGYAEALEPFPDTKKPNEPDSDNPAGGGTPDTDRVETRLGDQESEEGEPNEPDSDNPAGGGTPDTDGSETASKGRRKR
ncbi:MAG: hypothetical protein ACYDGZ_27305 [Desulfosporosinus fructosivorans]